MEECQKFGSILSYLHDYNKLDARYASVDSDCSLAIGRRRRSISIMTSCPVDCCSLLPKLFERPESDGGITRSSHEPYLSWCWQNRQIIQTKFTLHGFRLFTYVSKEINFHSYSIVIMYCIIAEFNTQRLIYTW